MNRPVSTISATFACAVLASCSLLSTGCASTKGDTAEEQRVYARSTTQATLKDFYQEDGTIKKKMEKSAGYGVFSNIGTNLIFVSTGGGYGVVHNNKTGKNTYMKMGEVGVGLGLGAKDFRTLFLFESEQVLNKFISSGWEFGGEADAAAKAGDQGGEASGAGNVHSGITVYQMTENGLALSATVSGTKYWVDKELN